MSAPPLHSMLLLVIGMYLATYGPGRVLVHWCGIKVGSFQERLGISCALGAAVIGWLGYVASVAALPWLAVVGAWAAMSLGLVMVVRGFTWARETCDLTHRNRAALGLAILLGLLFAAGMNYWQLHYHPDGSITGRFLWPDLLYRNAVMGRLMACDGPLEWPWLVGEPMKGMSLLRFAAIMPVMKALGLSTTVYQVAALWLGLFGVPVGACAAFAFYRALGTTQTVGAWAVVLTGFLGNPRWLLNDRFAHSPALHWAGTDVFAVTVPVFFGMLALVVWAIRCGAGACTPPDVNGAGGVRAPALQNGALWLAVFMLASGTGHVPYESLSLYAGLPLYFVITLFRREGRRTAAILSVGALLGLLVLKLVMGSGAGAGPPLAGLAPSPTIRGLSWAFPFLSEPLRPLLAHLGPTSLMKLMKFAAVYVVAVGFYLWGSMWVRMVIAPNAYRFPWARLKEPVWSFGLAVVIAGVGLSSLLDFNRLAYANAQYDVLRTLWPALALANVAVAVLLVEKWPLLRRGWGLALLLVLVFYGSWENTQLVLWSRTTLEQSTIPGDEVAALQTVAARCHTRDLLLIDPRAPVSGTTTGHNWGYVSGLLPCRVWLDNENMSRKFGQGAMWDARWAEFEAAVQSPAAFRAFLSRHQFAYVMAETPQLAALAQAAGGTESCFQQGRVTLFSVRAATP